LPLVAQKPHFSVDLLMALVPVTLGDPTQSQGMLSHSAAVKALSKAVFQVPSTSCGSKTK